MTNKQLKLLCGEIIKESNLSHKSKQLLYEYVLMEKNDINLKSFLLNGNIKKLNENEKININNKFNNLIESINNITLEDSFIFLNCAKEAIINSIIESHKLKDEELESTIYYIMNECNDYQIMYMLLNNKFPKKNENIFNIFEEFNSITSLNIIPLSEYGIKTNNNINILEADTFIGQSKENLKRSEKEFKKNLTDTEQKIKKNLQNNKFIQNAEKSLKNINKNLRELPSNVKKNIEDARSKSNYRMPTWDEYKQQVKGNIKLTKDQYDKLKEKLKKNAINLKQNLNKGIIKSKEITNKLIDKAAEGGGGLEGPTRKAQKKQILSQIGHIESGPRGNKSIPAVTLKNLNQSIDKLEARKEKWIHTKGIAADKIKKQINDEIELLKKQRDPFIKNTSIPQKLSTKMPVRHKPEDVLQTGINKTKEFMKSAGEKISGTATDIKHRIVNTLSNLPSAKDIGNKVNNSQTTKILGGVALAALMGYASYKLYRNYMSQAAKSCSYSQNKSECMKKYRQNAIKIQISDLSKAQKSCINSKNPQKCQISINKKVSDLKQELSRVL